MLSKCMSCGISEKTADGKMWCIKYKFEISQETTIGRSECHYLIEPQFEDGELMNALQNLMLKESELASRRMRGPV